MLSASAKVRVLRMRPRPRNKIDGLAGVIEAVIETRSFLHVGSGTEKITGLPSPEQLDRVQKNHKLDEIISELKDKIQIDYLDFSKVADRPCIPASSVKGNVRSRIELSFISKNGMVNSCFIRSSSPATADSRYASRHKKIWGQVLKEDRGFGCDFTRDAQVCLVCDLFGTAGLKGLVEFGDFILEKGDLQKIDGPYGLKLLAAPPNSQFKGMIGFTNLKFYELGLLFHGMGLERSTVGREVLMGRLKYVAKVGDKRIGRIRYRLESLRISSLSQPQVDLRPGSKIAGPELDRLVEQAVKQARTEFDEHLRTVKEVDYAI